METNNFSKSEDSCDLVHFTNFKKEISCVRDDKIIEFHDSQKFDQFQQIKEIEEINEINITIEKWEKDLYDHYNDAYRFYLNNQPPMIFMHHFLEKIINTTKSSSGYILSIKNNEDNKILTNIEAIFKDKLYDDSILFHTWEINLDVNSKSFNCIKNETPIIFNDIENDDVKNEPINIPPNGKSYVCIPFKFNDKIIGIFGLFRNQNMNNKFIDFFKLTGNLIANLQNSYFKVKMTVGYNDKKIITYRLLDDILNTVHDGILIIDENYDIVHSNYYSTQLFNDISPEFKKIEYESNKNLLKLFPQLEQLNCEKGIKKIFKNKKGTINIHEHLYEGCLEFTFNTVICGGHFYHLVTIHNMITGSNKKNLNTKYLMAFLSHELRNPLQSITLANHLIKTGIKNPEVSQNIPSKIISYFDIINKSCQNMKKIINDVLDLSRIESGEFSIDMEMCDIETLIDSIIDDNIYEASLKGLEIEKEILKGTPYSIFTDPVRVTQILGNLISNAIKYSDFGKIKIIISRDNLSNVKFSVIDQGIGIKHDELSKLFKTYGQTSNSKSTFNSQGLGLCVSQKIANLMGGKITVKSEFQKGSTFSFYHPVKLGMSGCKYETDLTIGELSGNVLLVDDNQNNLLLLHTLLEQFNYEYVWVIKIESVDSGDKAIELCKINNYDIIFMDINMPGISGSSACKIIKANGFKGKIIATTGNILSRCENTINFDINNNNNNNNNTNNDSYSYFDDIIIKPFDDQIVIQKLRNFLSCK